jgi:hypothetical protein
MTRRQFIRQIIAIGFLSPELPYLAEAQEMSTTGKQSPAWPDATNTGVPPGETLAPYFGNLTVTSSGARISGLDVHGTVTISAPGVTLENCRITAQHSWDWYVVLTGGDSIIRDCTINGGNINPGQNGINGGGRFFRNDIFNTENGIAPGSHTLIEGNYIHDLNAPGAPHYDGIQLDGGQSDVIIQHNTILNSWIQTSAVMINNWAGPISNVQIVDNLLVGGGYTIYVDGRRGNHSISTVSISNNHIGPGRWGVVQFKNAAPLYTGNANDGAELARSLRLRNE